MAGPGWARLGRRGGARAVWCGEVWFGRAWQAWHGEVGHGWVRSGWAWRARFGGVWQARRGLARLGEVWQGEARLGWRGLVRLGGVWCGKAWQGKVMSDTPQLDHLIHRLGALVYTATSALQSDMSRADDWYDEIARQLRRYTLAAYVSGQGDSRDVPRKVIAQYVATQLDFLAAFRDEIKAAGEWSNGWAPRAQMYAESIKAPWWSGATRDWPLPAMPGDGTSQCLTRCKCSWRVDELEGDGNADAYWIYGATEGHCQTCIERSQQWAPLRIRGGELL